ncbi:MAG: Lrp/AsnC family transcriptional regulator [Halovenus sp.]
MTDAFVHAIVEPSAITEAAAVMAEAERVEDVHLVTGEYDVVAQLDLETKDDIATAVTDDIHSVSGVVETVTNVAFEI